MPYSDNMYTSLHDSDTESELDENQLLAPSDGYFRASATTTSEDQASPQSAHQPHIPNVWVRDPSLEQDSSGGGGSSSAAAESKASEATQERVANRSSNTNRRQTSSYVVYTTDTPTDSSSSTSRVSPSISSRPTHTRYTPSSPLHASTARNTRSPSIYSARSSGWPSEAPPAYTPSPTSPSSSSGPSDFSRNYRTFSHPTTMGRDVEEAQGLLAAEPQSMGGNPDDDFSAAPGWRDRLGQRLSFFSRRNWRMLLLCFLLLLITIGFLVTSIQSVPSQKNKMPSDSVPNDRVTRPTEPAPSDYPAFDGSLKLNDICKDIEHKYPRQQFPVSFSPGRSLFFRQKLDKDDPGSGHRVVRVSGDVVLRRQTGSEGPSIMIDMMSNDDSISVGVEFDEDSQTLTLTTTRSIPWENLDSARNLPCLNIRATIWVPENAVLENLDIDNVHLGVKLLDNLSISVADQVILASVVGKIVAATNGQEENKQLIRDGAPSYFALSSRSIDVRTTSASIQGSWPLYDQLRLASVSGSITAGVEPKKANPESAKPANLDIKTTSGNIEFYEPIEKAQVGLAQKGQPVTLESTSDAIPPREYTLSVHSESGHVSGSAAFTSVAHLHSTSGSLVVDLLPVLPKKLAAAVPYSEGFCSLQTSTTSASSTVHVLDPLWVDMVISDGHYALPSSPSPPSGPPPPPSGPPARDSGPDDGRYVPIGNRDPYDFFPPAAPPTMIGPGAKRSVGDGQAASAAREEGARRLLHIMQASHSSISGKIALKYPASWEGDISMTTLSARLSVGGKDVHIIRSGKDWPGVETVIVARKGDVDKNTASSIKTHTISGTTTLNFPE